MKAVEIASKAADLVSGDRAAQHGDKKKNFENTAALWNAFIFSRPNPNGPLTASDCASLMVLLKLARTQTGSLNPDDYVDMAGYSAVLGEIAGA